MPESISMVHQGSDRVQRFLGADRIVHRLVPNPHDPEADDTAPCGAVCQPDAILTGVRPQLGRVAQCPIDLATARRERRRRLTGRVAA